MGNRRAAQLRRHAVPRRRVPAPRGGERRRPRTARRRHDARRGPAVPRQRPGLRLLERLLLAGLHQRHLRRGDGVSGPGRHLHRVGRLLQRQQLCHRHRRGVRHLPGGDLRQLRPDVFGRRHAVLRGPSPCPTATRRSRRCRATAAVTAPSARRTPSSRETPWAPSRRASAPRSRRSRRATASATRTSSMPGSGC